MKDNASTAPRWYEFDLVNEARSRGFIQPKGGVNINLTDNMNVFGNYAHAERFVDLGVFYNQGRVAPDVEDEKSDQIEAGLGWTSSSLTAKVNGYRMTWSNKSAYIRDVSKAGEPGYDRNGNRSELVGKSVHQGIEAEATLKLDDYLHVKGLELTGSLTIMDNRWTEVLDAVLNDPITGARRAFNASALNEKGIVDALYFDELKDTPVASGPQTMLAVGLNYRVPSFFVGVNVNYCARIIALDGGSYLATDGGWAFVGGKRVFDPKFDSKLPAFTVVNLNVGTSFNLLDLRTMASIQVLNALDNEFFADADRYGVIPGLGRAFRLNLSAGF